MAEITVLSALAGGALIGAASALLFIKSKRVAGISGIAAGILRPRDNEFAWRLWFIFGLLLSAPLYKLVGWEIPIHIQTPLLVLAISGLLVGYGTRLGGGCTSGHGVCGIARLSIRSIVATVVFMLTAGVSVFIVRHIL
jgi:uncharacterized membrane protein YedE/YeeE